jgi:alcohol dehydrogenase
VDLLVDRVVGLLGAAGMPRSLADAGADPSRIGALASEAARQWTATFNPRPAETADFARLYEAAFETGTASER